MVIITRDVASLKTTRTIILIETTTRIRNARRHDGTLPAIPVILMMIDEVLVGLVIVLRARAAVSVVCTLLA